MTVNCSAVVDESKIRTYINNTQHVIGPTREQQVKNQERLILAKKKISCNLRSLLEPITRDLNYPIT